MGPDVYVVQCQSIGGTVADQLHPPDAQVARNGPHLSTAVADSQHLKDDEPTSPLESALQQRQIVFVSVVQENGFSLSRPPALAAI